MRPHLLLILSAAALATTGCHSPYIAATVTNQTAQPLQLIEVDYPSASFGIQNLAPGASFHYRFKVLGSGNLKLLYTDSARKDHTYTGPELTEGAEGPLTIDILPTGAQWKTPPHHP